jgi:MoaA/NifB/PqqE/SkfB family radical SAM enzyme
MEFEILRKVNQKVFPNRFKFGPEWIVLGVNNVCNLHCKMCDVGTQNLDSNFAQNLVGTSPLNMPLELIQKVLDQTALHYPKAKVGYAFTEPLVYPKLVESLEYANKLGLTTTVTTNALTLKSKAEKLCKAGLDEIYISLDGPAEIHNEIRGHKKSFQKAIEGIEALNNFSNKPKISIICAITEWNIGHLIELIESLSHLKIDEFAFMHTQFNSEKAAELHNASPWGKLYPTHDSNIDLIDFSNMDFDLLLKEIEEINHRTDIPAYFSPEIKEMTALKEYYLQPEKIIGKGCHAVFNSVMVKSDGSVIPAHGRCFNLTIGNVYESSMKDIWSSTVLAKLRGDLKDAGGLFPGCSRCCSGF